MTSSSQLAADLYDLDEDEINNKDNLHFVDFDEARGSGMFNYGPAQPPPRPRLKKLKPGAYEMTSTMKGIAIEEWKFPDVDIIETPDSPSFAITEFVRHTFDPVLQERMRLYKEMNKAGILMYGPGGTGKTFTIYKAAEEAVAAGWIVLVEPKPTVINIFIDLIRSLPEQDDDQPIMILWEEIDTNLRYYRDELSNFLDGKTSRTNCLTLATTNYIDKLPRNFWDRPSRFQLIIELAGATEGARRGYFKNKLLPGDMDQWYERFVADTENWTMDNCKALVLRVLVREEDYETVLEDLRKRSSSKVVASYVQQGLSETDWAYLLDELSDRFKDRLEDFAGPAVTNSSTIPTPSAPPPAGLRSRLVGVLETLAGE